MSDRCVSLFALHCVCCFVFVFAARGCQMPVYVCCFVFIFATDAGLLSKLRRRSCARAKDKQMPKLRSCAYQYAIPLSIFIHYFDISLLIFTQNTKQRVWKAKATSTVWTWLRCLAASAPQARSSFRSICSAAAAAREEIRTHWCFDVCRAELC